MDCAAADEVMERQKATMPISNPGQSALSSVEAPFVRESYRETHTMDLLLVPITALIVWLLIGGWLYFVGLPAY
jgi:hypothetical protein